MNFIFFLYILSVEIILADKSYINKTSKAELLEKETKENLVNLLKKIDKNRDLHIDNFELEVWISKNIKQSDFDNSVQKLQIHDQNNDGKLTWSEYLISTHQYDETTIDVIRNYTNISSHTKEFLKEIDLMQRKFKIADMNKDGALSKEEYVNFEHPEHFPFMAPVEIDLMLYHLDTNGDGFISSEEYLEPDHLNKNEEKENFNKYDKDHNGKLDRSEILTLAMPGIEATSKHEAIHLLGEPGNKGVKALSFQQIVPNYLLWIKSPATDFGRQLTPKKVVQKDEL